MMPATNRSSAAPRSDVRGPARREDEVLAGESSRNLAFTKPVRVMLAGTENIVLSGLERLFNLESDCLLVARCQKAEQIPFVVGACQPDLLVAHLPESPDANATALLREIRGLTVPTRVVLVPSRLAQRIRRAHTGGAERNS